MHDIDAPATSGASLDGVTLEISDDEDLVDNETVHYEAVQDEEPDTAPECAPESSENPSHSHPAGLVSADNDSVRDEAVQDEEPNAACESGPESSEKPSDSHPAEPNADEAAEANAPTISAVPSDPGASPLAESDGESVTNFEVVS